MDDYELANAREWDDSLAAVPPSPNQPRSEWKTVAGRRKQPKKENQGLPPPKAFPSDNNNTNDNTSNHHRTYTPAQPSPRPAPRQHPHPHRPRPTVSAASRQPPLRFSPQKRLPRQTNGFRERRQAPKPPVPRLVEDADNEAQYAWRERKPPTDTVRIPAVMVHADRSINDPPTYQQLAVDCGAFVYCDELKSDSVSLTFGIWGGTQAAAAAKHQILNWIEYAEPSSHKAPGSAQWSRIVSLTPKLRERAEKRWAKDIEKNRYRQFPPNRPFGAIGTFHWPSKEFRPEEAFGMSCEALDPIRMDYSCYITYDAEKSIFQIFGKDSDVQAALLCIRKTAFNICSRTINPVRAYLLQWRSGPPPSHIYLEEYMGPVIITDRSNNRVAQTPSFSPRGDGMLDEGLVELAHTRASVNGERVKITISNALRKVHYLQGHLNLRIRLGTFLLSQYMKLPESELWELEDYEAMVKASQFVGRVTEELGGEYPEQNVLPQLQRADHILSPQDAITEHLVDVRPSYAAEFVFDNGKGDLCLRVTWLETSESETDKLEFGESTKEWTRLDRDTGHATKLVDVSMTDPHNGSAWQFEMLSSEVVEHSKLPRELRHFADRVRIDPMAVRNKKSDDKSFITFNPFVQPKTVRQMIRYQYGIKGTDYTLELSQFQDWVYAARKSMADAVEPTVFEPRWGLSVFRVEWDTMFTKNARLTIGASADWTDEMENWFPQDWVPDDDDEGKQDGFGQLLRKLAKIEKLVREPVLG